jgi:hypothetical protein
MAEALMLKDVSRRGPGSHADEPSRARAARGLAATVFSLDGRANVAREMERGMRLY